VLLALVVAWPDADTLRAGRESATRGTVD
jgi:hypothetical protein